jgi:hypothetical protein
MNYIFDSFSDATLRRLFKFVLKRVLGKYLDEDVVLDQIQVQSRKGTVAISNLLLNVAVINEEIFSNFPIKLICFKIASLEGRISYSSILSEGFHLEINGVHMTFKEDVDYQKSSSLDSQFTIPIPLSSTISNIEDFDSKSASSVGRESLSFIANWIDVLITSVYVTVSNLTIVLETKNSLDSCLFTVSKFQYSNSQANQFRGDSSVSLTSKLQNNNISLDDFGSSKVI